MREYPWRLKLVHEGHRFIRVDRPGRFFAFEPNEAFHEVGLLLGGEDERLRGLRETAENGMGEVVVSEALESLVSQLGGIEVHTWPTEVDGVHFEAMSYYPHRQPDRKSGVLKMRRALKSPRKAAVRLFETGQASNSEAAILQLTLPDGGRLLHLDVSLHEEADLEWIAAAQERFRGADWVICGVEFGQDQAVLRHLSGFDGKINLIADLVNDERRERGLETNLLTPTVDALIELGVTAFPFPPKSSFRFEA